MKKKTKRIIAAVVIVIIAAVITGRAIFVSKASAILDSAYEANASKIRITEYLHKTVPVLIEYEYPTSWGEPAIKFIEVSGITGRILSSKLGNLHWFCKMIEITAEVETLEFTPGEYTVKSLGTATALENLKDETALSIVYENINTVNNLVIFGFYNEAYHVKYMLERIDWPEFRKVAENNGWVFEKTGHFFIGTKPQGTGDKAKQQPDEKAILEAMRNVSKDSDPCSPQETGDWPPIP